MIFVSCLITFSSASTFHENFPLNHKKTQVFVAKLLLSKKIKILIISSSQSVFDGQCTGQGQKPVPRCINFKPKVFLLKPWQSF